MSECPPTPPGPPGDLLRQIPQVEKILQLPGIVALSETTSRLEVTDAVRHVLDALRTAILRAATASSPDGGPVSWESRLEPDALVEAVRVAIDELRRSAYRRVINGTGVILHTGLGRAVLPEAAVRSIVENASGYCLLEVDVSSGERGRRDAAVAAQLRELTGAEDATVVNNNAAATLLILASIARGKEVIISRGQLVEIGGSFRIPDILRESGARLVEVGTTNRTYASDYRGAIGPETGMILQVHTSNYEIAGFAEHTPLGELVALGREHDLPVASDLGSGCFYDVGAYGFRPEPLARDAIHEGADLVCFSGDKLLGGPQAGIIVGRKCFVDRVRSHPLCRPLRLDKLGLLALEATLRAHRNPERLRLELPVLRAVTESQQSVRSRAATCLEQLGERVPSLSLEVVPSMAQAGSGALPAQEIPSAALSIRHARWSCLEVARRLRDGAPPVFARIQNDAVLIDFRTVLPGEEPVLVEAIARLNDGENEFRATPPSAP